MHALAKEHEVERVSDGAAALVRLEEPGAFDSVMPDLSLPTLDGEEVWRRLCARGCSLPLLFSSGSGDPAVEDPHTLVLSKLCQAPTCARPRVGC